MMVLMATACCSSDLSAQGFLKKLKEGTADKAKDKIEQKADNAVDGVINGTEKAAKNAEKGSDRKTSANDDLSVFTLSLTANTQIAPEGVAPLLPDISPHQKGSNMPTVPPG